MKGLFAAAVFFLLLDNQVQSQITFGLGPRIGWEQKPKAILIGGQVNVKIHSIILTPSYETFSEKSIRNHKMNFDLLYSFFSTPKMQLYSGCGLASQFNDADIIVSLVRKSKIHTGFNLLIGTQTQIKRWNIFGNIRYTIIKQSDYFDGSSKSANSLGLVLGTNFNFTK
ncbi:hypothetical protein K1X84_08850 [bacterium]|nr:hypothetical protein [bacterium]